MGLQLLGESEGRTGDERWGGRFWDVVLNAGKSITTVTLHRDGRGGMGRKGDEGRLGAEGLTCGMQGNSWHASIAEIGSKIVFAAAHYYLHRRAHGPDLKKGFVQEVGGATVGVVEDLVG